MYNYPTVKMLLGKILIFVSLIAVTLLYIIFGKPEALGFAAGIISMFINWRLLAIQNEKVVNEKRSGGFVYFFVFVRYAIIASVSAACFLAKEISGMAAVAGVLFSQVYIFVFALILTNKERGNKDA